MQNCRGPTARNEFKCKLYPSKRRKETFESRMFNGDIRGRVKNRKTKKLMLYLLRYNCFPCDFDACADCAAKEGEKIENLAEKKVFYEFELRI